MLRNKYQKERKSIRERLSREVENFVGVGIGDATDDKYLREDCIIIYVTKLTASHKRFEHKFEDETKTDVKFVEVGEIDLTAFTGRYRAAQCGAVIGAQGYTAKGTMGAIVTDNTDGQQVILSCSHVIANFGTAPLGTAILQPGPGNGGTSADRIGALKRVVPNNLVPNGINYVDAAIASIDDPTYVSATPFFSQVNPAVQGAVGLLWSASSAITILNPINNVLSMLNVSVPKQKDATVGMSLHGCTAVTGYKTVTVAGVMVDLLLSNMWWLDQITVAGNKYNGTAGDSGTMMYTTFAV